jgi:hypothetical protein
VETVTCTCVHQLRNLKQLNQLQVALKRLAIAFVGYKRNIESRQLVRCNLEHSKEALTVHKRRYFVFKKTALLCNFFAVRAK